MPNLGQLRPLLSFIFGLFHTNIITIFTTNKCEECPSNIRCRDSNPQPLEHESPPITTRPGLLKFIKHLYPYITTISIVSVLE